MDLKLLLYVKAHQVMYYNDLLIAVKFNSMKNKHNIIALLLVFARNYLKGMKIKGIESLWIDFIQVLSYLGN